MTNPHPHLRVRGGAVEQVREHRALRRCARVEIDVAREAIEATANALMEGIARQRRLELDWLDEALLDLERASQEELSNDEVATVPTQTTFLERVQDREIRSP